MDSDGGDQPQRDAGCRAPMRYRTLWRHATGGLGEIFAALDTDLDRRVALKKIQRAQCLIR